MVTSYRSAINKAISSKDTGDLEKIFASGSSSYQDVVDNILPQLWNDGLEGYDSTTTSITINSSTDTSISATVNFNTLSRYKDGRVLGPSDNSRNYEIVREGDVWLISSF